MDVDSFLGELRVLAVDDDSVCLKILEMQLRHWKYNVTAVTHAETALEMLRERKDGEQFDLVISDVHMPDMDGFKLLELVGLEMDIPVIMLSANEEMETMMKGIKHGACDYLLKPVHLDRLKNIWVHVVKKSKNDPRNHISGTNNDAEKEEQSRAATGEKDCADDTKKYSRKNRKDGDDAGEDSDNTRSGTQKKQRIQWSGPLHSKFVEAVHQIGIDRAVPKKIWEFMNVDGITREHVASHLQKYRRGLKRLLGTPKQLNPFPADTESWRDWNYINMNGLDSHQPVQPMSSQRNLTIPFFGPAGHGGNLLSVQEVNELTSSGNSYGNTSNDGLSSDELFFPGPLDTYIENNVPNCMVLHSSRFLPAAISGNSFENISNGTQPLAAGLCNNSSSWNAEAPLMFPGHGHHVGTSGGPSRLSGLNINQLATSSGPMTTMANTKFQNQMEAYIGTSAPVIGFSEQSTLFSLGSNANSTSVPNNNSALASASSISPALPSIQIDNYDIQTQMLNGGAGSGNLLENDCNGIVDQQFIGDLMGTSQAQNQMSGHLHHFVADDGLDPDSQNSNAAVDSEWQ